MLDVIQLIIGDNPQLARTTANTKPRARARFLYFSAKTLNFRSTFSSKNKEPRHGRGLVLDVTQGGFEPPTLRAEI